MDTMDVMDTMSRVVNATMATPGVGGNGNMLDSCIFFWFMPGCYAYWYELFLSISPDFWAVLGVVMAIGVSVLGSAWGIFITGTLRVIMYLSICVL